MKNKKIIFTLSHILALTILTIPLITLAQSGNMNIKIGDLNPIDAKDIYVLIHKILDFVIKIGAVVVIFFLIYAGFQFVTAQGSDDKISKAKSNFTWTVIGALVLLGAFALSEIICNTAAQLGATVSCGAK